MTHWISLSPSGFFDVRIIDVIVIIIGRISVALGHSLIDLI